MSAKGSTLGEKITLERLARFTWYLLGAYLALLYVRGPVTAAWPDTLGVIQALVGLLLLIALFLVIPAALSTVATTPVSHGHAFPSAVTVIVGVWLVVMSVASALALLLALFPPSWLATWLAGWEVPASSTLAIDASDALITMSAAAVGSTITTIQGYLKHASTESDFKTSFAPWYVARPLMGTLLGLLFYLVLKAGLLLLNTGGGTTINRWGVAAVGGLVGLSSKDAIEKLKEVFQTMFRTASSKDGADDAAEEWTASQLDALISKPDQ